MDCSGMALQIYNNQLLKRLLISKLSTLGTNNYKLLSNKVITLEVSKLDVIDNFTNDLIIQKALKWNKVRIRSRPQAMCPLIKPEVVLVDLSNLSQVELDKEFLLTVQDGTVENIIAFLHKCENSCVCPSFFQIEMLLNANSRNGSIEIVQAVKNLYKTYDECLYEANAGFKHYLAEAYWIKGDVVKALPLFEEVLVSKPCLRRRVKLTLKDFIADVTMQSEAVLISIMKFSEKLFVSYGDPFVLICLWQACFTSECYSDQKLALTLLKTNKTLCEAVVDVLPYVVTSALKQHHVEVVYRLLEVLIEHGMKSQYYAILVSLFNYKYLIGDLKSCSEIIHWSASYNVPLPNFVHERFLMLLLRRNNIDDVKPEKPSAPIVELKF